MPGATELYFTVNWKDQPCSSRTELFSTEQGYILQMEYLSADHPELTVKLTCKATRDTAHPPSADLIIDSLVDRASCIEPREHTNRQMWPNSELVGVDFEQETPYLNGNIQSREVELQFYGFDGFEKAYDTVAEWCDGTPIELPPKDEFLVQTVSLQLDDDDRGLALDETKYKVQTLLGGMTYEAAGVTGEYDAYNGWITLFLRDGNGASRQDVRSHLEEFLSNDYVIIAPSDEIEDKFNSNGAEWSDT